MQWRAKHPVSPKDIFLQWNRSNTLRADGELAAAWLRKHIWDRVGGKQFLPSPAKNSCFGNGADVICILVWLGFWMDVVRAARVVGAAQVHVASAHDIVGIELGYSEFGAVAEKGIVMPRCIMGMHEDGDVVQVVVVVDDVGEIWHQLMAFILDHKGVCLRVVHDVNGGLEARIVCSKPVDPGCVFFFELCNDQPACVGVWWMFGLLWQWCPGAGVGWSNSARCLKLLLLYDALVDLYRIGLLKSHCGERNEEQCADGEHHQDTARVDCEASKHGIQAGDIHRSIYLECNNRITQVRATKL